MKMKQETKLTAMDPNPTSWKQNFVIKSNSTDQFARNKAFSDFTCSIIRFIFGVLWLCVWSRT